VFNFAYLRLKVGNNRLRRLSLIGKRNELSKALPETHLVKTPIDPDLLAGSSQTAANDN
jgi:hypothetical protein